MPCLGIHWCASAGLFVELELRPEPREATLLRRGAVQGSEDSPWVYVFENGKAAVRRIQLREFDAARVEILEGLAPGERVLVGPSLSQLADGAPVVLEVPHADR